MDSAECVPGVKSIGNKKKLFNFFSTVNNSKPYDIMAKRKEERKKEGRKKKEKKKEAGHFNPKDEMPTPFVEEKFHFRMCRPHILQIFCLCLWDGALSC